MDAKEALNRAIKGWLVLYEIHGMACDEDSEAVAVLRAYLMEILKHNRGRRNAVPRDEGEGAR